MSNNNSIIRNSIYYTYFRVFLFYERILGKDKFEDNKDYASLFVSIILIVFCVSFLLLLCAFCFPEVIRITSGNNFVYALIGLSTLILTFFIKLFIVKNHSKIVEKYSIQKQQDKVHYGWLLLIVLIVIVIVAFLNMYFSRIIFLKFTS